VKPIVRKDSEGGDDGTALRRKISWGVLRAENNHVHKGEFLKPWMIDGRYKTHVPRMD
jgi:hypothetical protein